MLIRRLRWVLKMSQQDLVRVKTAIRSVHEDIRGKLDVLELVRKGRLD